jgi:thiamine biosynthesis protein ThiI
MGQRPTLALVHLFHEIALKGGNRSFFLKAAFRSIESALVGTGVGRIERRSMVGLVPLEAETQWPLVKERLGYVIGVERFGLAWRVPPAMDQIKEAVAGALEGVSASSFRITAHRVDKGFPLDSPQINQELGVFVQGLTGLPVDLKHPDLNIRVYVHAHDALVTRQESPGVGGLPIGVGGHVAQMISGGIDSPVAAYMMMKRGCNVSFIHFHSFPLVEGTSREKAQDLVELLTRYQGSSRLLLVPFAEAQKKIILAVPPAYRVIIYRRFMIRITEALATAAGAGAMVTGDSLGQVSSQTLDNLATIEAARERLPIFRPLIGMDKEEVIQRAKALGTYPISIIPDQDCCSLFVPKHPATRSRTVDVEAMEAQLDVAAIVQEALEGVQERRFQWPEADRPTRVAPAEAQAGGGLVKETANDA